MQIIKQNWIVLTLALVVIISMLIYFYSFRGKDERFLSSSCKSVLVKLANHLPKDWRSECEKENLKVTMILKDKIIDISRMKELLYRELANNAYIISQSVPLDSVRYVTSVLVRLEYDKGAVVAACTGNDLAILSSLKEATDISEFMKRSVKVIEIAK